MKYINYSIIAILVTTLISTCFSIDIILSAFGSLKKIDGFLSLVIYVFLFYMTLMCVKRKDVGLFVYGICFVAGLTSVYGLLQFYRIYPIFWLYDYQWEWSYDYKTHVGSTFGNAAFFSAYLSMAIPLILYGILRGGKYSKLQWLLLTLVVYAMLITSKRGAVISIIVALLYFVFLYRNLFIKYIAIGLTCAIIIVIILSPSCILLDRFADTYEGIENRIRLARVGCSIIKDNLWNGIGPDCLILVYRKAYLVVAEAKYYELQASLHNQVLDILVFTGVPGLIAWVCFLFMYFKCVWKNRDNLLVVALSSSVVAYLVNNQASYSTMPLVLTFWILVALTLISVKKNNKLV